MTTTTDKTKKIGGLEMKSKIALLLIVAIAGCDNGDLYVQPTVGECIMIEDSNMEKNVVSLRLMSNDANIMAKGTGILMSGESGIVYTAKHCVGTVDEPVDIIQVCIGAPVISCYRATVIAHSEITDQALLKVNNWSQDLVDKFEDTVGFGAKFCEEYKYGDRVIGYHHKGDTITMSIGVTHETIPYIQSGNMDHGSSGGPIYSLIDDCLYGTHNGDYGEWERFATPDSDLAFMGRFIEINSVSFE
jgi:hypothetical protein